MNNANAKNIEANNLKVIKDQLEHEVLMNKKYNECGGQCTDASIKSLCSEAGQIHRQNFDSLKSYLDSHQ